MLQETSALVASHVSVRLFKYLEYRPTVNHLGESGPIHLITYLADVPEVENVVSKQAKQIHILIAGAEFFFSSSKVFNPCAYLRIAVKY